MLNKMSYLGERKRLLLLLGDKQKTPDIPLLAFLCCLLYIDSVMLSNIALFSLN